MWPARNVIGAHAEAKKYSMNCFGSLVAESSVQHAGVKGLQQFHAEANKKYRGTKSKVYCTTDSSIKPSVKHVAYMV